MVITRDELEALCAYIDIKITLPDQPGEHCDATPKYASEYLESIGEINRLDDYIDIGRGCCDCTLLMNFPGTFPDEDEHAQGGVLLPFQTKERMN